MPLKNFLNSIKVRSIKFHALRACVVTQMLANGAPSPIVMKIGGWKKSSPMQIKMIYDLISPFYELVECTPILVYSRGGCED